MFHTWLIKLQFKGVYRFWFWSGSLMSHLWPVSSFLIIYQIHLKWSISGISRYLSSCVCVSLLQEFTHMSKGFWFSSVNWAVICRLLWQRLSEPQAFRIWIWWSEGMFKQIDLYVCWVLTNFIIGFGHGLGLGLGLDSAMFRHGFSWVFMGSDLYSNGFCLVLMLVMIHSDLDPDGLWWVLIWVLFQWILFGCSPWIGPVSDLVSDGFFGF